MTVGELLDALADEPREVRVEFRMIDDRVCGTTEWGLSTVQPAVDRAGRVVYLGDGSPESIGDYLPSPDTL